MADTNSRHDNRPAAATEHDAAAATATGTGTDARAAGSLPNAGAMPKEIGGRDGPEPTRFGDWEKAGRCIDF
jgi:hypothetical protein